MGGENSFALGRDIIGGLTIAFHFADAQTVALELGQQCRRFQQQKTITGHAADGNVQFGQQPIVANGPCLYHCLRGLGTILQPGARSEAFGRAHFGCAAE